MPWPLRKATGKSSCSSGMRLPWTGRGSGNHQEKLQPSVSVLEANISSFPGLSLWWLTGRRFTAPELLKGALSFSRIQIPDLWIAPFYFRVDENQGRTEHRWKGSTSSCPSRHWGGQEWFPVYQGSVTKDKTRTSVGCMNSNCTKTSTISPVIFLAFCNIFFGNQCGRNGPPFFQAQRISEKDLH